MKSTMNLINIQYLKRQLSKFIEENSYRNELAATASLYYAICIDHYKSMVGSSYNFRWK